MEPIVNLMEVETREPSNEQPNNLSSTNEDNLLAKAQVTIQVVLSHDMVITTGAIFLYVDTARLLSLIYISIMMIY